MEVWCQVGLLHPVGSSLHLRPGFSLVARRRAALSSASSFAGLLSLAPPRPGACQIWCLVAHIPAQDGMWRQPGSLAHVSAGLKFVQFRRPIPPGSCNAENLQRTEA